MTLLDQDLDGYDEYACGKCGAKFGIFGTSTGSDEDFDADSYFDEEVEYHVSGECSPPRHASVPVVVALPRLSWWRRVHERRVRMLAARCLVSMFSASSSVDGPDFSGDAQRLAAQLVSAGVRLPLAEAHAARQGKQR